MSPLVSVLMPCYNSARTLPLALASLLAQTYEDWECVFVDDGSTDAPESVLAAIQDPRVRYFRLERNLGRGFARQVALEQARGDLIAMLDADDWLYPRKLEAQVRSMLSHRDVAVLGAGMAIVNESSAVTGVRGLRATGDASLVQGPWRTLRMPPVAFGPSMIRAEIAKEFQFNERFLLGEDVEYLLRLMLGRQYGVLPQVLYAYSEHGSVSSGKVASAFGFERKMFLGFRRQYPVASRVNALKAQAKAGIYRTVEAVGAWDWAIARRSRRPTAEQEAEFLEARAAVERVAEEVFGVARAGQAEACTLCGNNQ